MTKILFVSNTANFSKFNRPFMQWFKKQGWQVDYVSAGEKVVLDCDKQYTICIARNPFNLKNFRAYKELKNILLNDYDIIHCHTPMGGVLARLAARKSRAKVIYTVHGFHFYKGAPFFNWMIYYPIEKFLMKYTDCLVTINQEDYYFASQKFKMPVGLFHIDGIGVDINRFYPISIQERKQVRKNFGLCDKDFILLYIAEFIPRKNHSFLLRQLPLLRQSIPEIKVLFAGEGELFKTCKANVAKLRVTEIVHFLGYRNDVEKLCQIADIHISPSKQEGLAVSNIEAMASGLPLLCSKIRGAIDAVTEGRNGFFFELNNPDKMVDEIIALYKNADLRETITRNNVIDAKKFSVDTVVAKMAKIYMRFMPPPPGLFWGVF
jgi:glycosyltransferase EpsD